MAPLGDRDSFDLDLAVGRDVPLRDLAEPGNPFRQTMGDLGGTAAYHERQWIIEFDAGEVDLVQLSPIPPGAERAALVNGHAAMVLDSSQILHGKLERADDALVRDVFDLIKANEHHPKALATAVNCRSRYDWIWLHILRGRSQKDRTAIASIARLAAVYWPSVRIRHPWPTARFAVKHPR